METGRINGDIIDIEYLSVLAQLELSEDEKERAAKDMENMLNYVGKLSGLDTENVEPLSHIFPINNVFREDVVSNGDDRENIIKNAPAKKDGSFIVPKTVE